jgi:hypothetical protein
MFIYLCICSHICVYIHMYLYAQICIHIYIRMFIFIYTCMHTNMHINMHIQGTKNLKAPALGPMRFASYLSNVGKLAPIPKQVTGIPEGVIRLGVYTYCMSRFCILHFY